MQFWQQLDLDLFRTIHIGWHSGPLDLLFLVLSYTGTGQVQLAACLGTFLSRRFRAMALPMVVAWTVSGLANTIVKHIVERGRPSLLEWAQPQEPHRWSSYPSGHTVTSFAIAFLIVFYFWPTRWRWISFGLPVWAALVGLSRVYRGVHWPTDVLGALGLGLASACLVAYFMPTDPRGFFRESSGSVEAKTDKKEENRHSCGDGSR